MSPICFIVTGLGFFQYFAPLLSSPSDWVVAAASRQYNSESVGYAMWKLSLTLATKSVYCPACSSTVTFFASRHCILPSRCSMYCFSITFVDEGTAEASVTCACNSESRFLARLKTLLTAFTLSCASFNPRCSSLQFVRRECVGWSRSCREHRT
jgi:hypothetical protein